MSGSIRLLLITILFFVLLAISSCERQEDIIHPDFTITKSQLKTMLSSLPDSITAKIMKKPQVFLDYMEMVLKEPQELFILVDKQYGLPSNYKPPDLVDLNKYNLTLSKKKLSLRRILLPDLLAMAESARMDGIEIVISSTFRSYQYQKTLFNYYVRKEGIEKAQKESARPGHSQHQLGTAIDFGNIDDSFIHTEQGKWLNANAWKYGFSLSYPKGQEDITGYKYEPWHFRYVGREASYLIFTFFNNNQQLFLEFYRNERDDFGSYLLSSKTIKKNPINQ